MGGEHTHSGGECTHTYLWEENVNIHTYTNLDNPEEVDEEDDVAEGVDVGFLEAEREQLVNNREKRRLLLGERDVGARPF